jgi:hypothetical protein
VKEFVRSYLSRDLRGQSVAQLVICDIDKTYLNTKFSTWRGLVRIPFEWAIDKRPIPGMVPLLRGLRRGLDTGHSAHPLFFVSGSPPELRGVIERRMVMDGVEFDGFLFKDQIGCIKRGRVKALTQQVAYKLYALSELWAGATKVDRVVMFGDDVEDDPFIFSIFRRVLLAEIEADALRDALASKGVLQSELPLLVSALLEHSGKLEGQEVLCVIRKVKSTSPIDYSNGVLGVTRTTEAAYALERRGFIGPETLSRVLAEDEANGLDWSREKSVRAKLNDWFERS